MFIKRLFLCLVMAVLAAILGAVGSVGGSIMVGITAIFMTIVSSAVWVVDELKK